MAVTDETSSPAAPLAAKGKRTMRQRQLTLLPCSTISTCSSVENSVISTEELEERDEYVANCLILLAKGHSVSTQLETAAVVSEKTTNGKCGGDVISRIAVLRGDQMPAMYSWSCKRVYRKRFVWEDLAEDDLILPSHGNDYILKGTLMMDQIHEVSLERSNNNLVLQKNLSFAQKDHFLYSRKHEASSSSSPVTTTTPSHPSSPHPLGDDIPLPFHRSSITLTGAPDSSSHTENIGEKKAPSSQTIIDSRNNGFSQAITKEKTSQTPVLWNAGMDTLMSLIQAEANDSFRGTKKRFSRSKEKMKRRNALLQLITCRLFIEKINIF